MQTHVLNIVGTVWFNRVSADDRVKSAAIMKEHIFSPTTNRLLIFPEVISHNEQHITQ
jgi:hypothetical protein